MVLPAPVSVEAGILEWAVSHKELGVPHPVVAPSGSWRPRAVRSEVDARARAECARLGWLDRTGRLDVEVVAALAVLCRAGVEFFGWIHDGERTIGVLAAATGREALLAVRDGDRVRLSQIRSSQLPEMLVGQIPDVPAGRMRPVRIARAELAMTTGDGRRRSETGVGSFPASGPARQVRELANLPTLGTGELHVAARDPVGHRRSLAEPLRYTDALAGRYAYRVSTDGGEEYVLVAGATRAELTTQLRQLHRTLTR